MHPRTRGQQPTLYLTQRALQVKTVCIFQHRKQLTHCHLNKIKFVLVCIKERHTGFSPTFDSVSSVNLEFCRLFSRTFLSSAPPGEALGRLLRLRLERCVVASHKTPKPLTLSSVFTSLLTKSKTFKNLSLKCYTSVSRNDLSQL